MCKILVIDDDKMMLQMMSDLLLRSGFIVFSAMNGKQGMKIYFNTFPDLVITDLVMPEKEGLETISELNKQHPRAKIIAISGGGRSGSTLYLSLAEDLGADQVLQKPFSKDELLYTVKNLLP